MATVKALPRPPGGELRCEPGQMAVIDKYKGKVYASCRSKPGSVQAITNGTFTTEFTNWVLGEVMAQKRDLNQTVTAEELAVFQARRFEYFADGYHGVREFMLPSDLGDGRTNQGGQQSGFG